MLKTSKSTSGQVMSTDAARSIIGICDECLSIHSNNCSGFAAEVASRCGIFLFGQANSIIDETIGSPSDAWLSLSSGREAGEAARSGLFVIGGLKANPNGHVVVVVDGPVKDGKYPYAYWGSYKAMKSFDGAVYNVGFTRGHGTINWAWGKSSVDKVQFSAAKPVMLLLNSKRPDDYNDRGRLQF